MIVSQIKDIIIESDSHAVLGKVLTLLLSRLSVVPAKQSIDIRFSVHPYGQADAIAFTIVRMKKGLLNRKFYIDRRDRYTPLWPYGQDNKGVWRYEIFF